MPFEKFELNGKTAVITGAGGLLGIEHASALLESGAKVVLTDISERALQVVKDQLSHQFDADRIVIQAMDVTQLAEISEVAETLRLRGERADILINNAAVDPKVKATRKLTETSLLEDITLEQWNQQISVGLTGAFLCCKIFGTSMVGDGQGGVILNVASDLSVIAPDQRLYRKAGLSDESQQVKPVTYSVIKTGLLGLTRYLATYWADKGVRCNALSPGGVFNGQDEEFVARLSNLIPMGRMATRSEYWSAVQFLCSDASSYMTGQNLVVDGGRSVW